MLLLSVISIRLLSWDCDVQYIRKKSKNVHAFFGYIAKNPKMCTAFSEKFSFTPGIFPKKNWNRSRFFQIFPEKVVHRVYFQNFWKRSGFPELFSKKFSLHWWLSEKVPQKVTPLSNFLQKNFYILTCHITDLEWFVCHFELKPSSGKVMSSPPCIELASCIQYICKKFENVHLFSEIFSIFLSGMKIDHAYPHQVYFQNFENQYRFFVFFWEKLAAAPAISPTWSSFGDILSSKHLAQKKPKHSLVSLPIPHTVHMQKIWKRSNFFWFFFQFFYQMSKSRWKMRGKILPKRNFSKK